MTNIHCASGLCQSDSRKSPNLKFANFPKPKFGLDRAKRWIHLLGRQNFHVENIKSYTKVCELHFDEGVNLNYLEVCVLLYFKFY